jgi:hypothetical protein
MSKMINTADIKFSTHISWNAADIAGAWSCGHARYMPLLQLVLLLVSDLDLIAVGSHRHGGGGVGAAEVCTAVRGHRECQQG